MLKTRKLLKYSDFILNSYDCLWLFPSHYLPMQHIRTINCQRFALLNGTSLIFTITLKVLGNSMCWFSNFSIYVLYRIFSAHLRKPQINFRGLIWWVFPHWSYKWFAKVKIRNILYHF